MLVLDGSCWLIYCLGVTTICVRRSHVRAILLRPCDTLRTSLQRVLHEHVPALSIAPVRPDIQEYETEVAMRVNLDRSQTCNSFTSYDTK